MQHDHVCIWKTACSLYSGFPFALSSNTATPRKGIGMLLHMFSGLGDTQPAARRVCSGNCVTRQSDQSLGSWQRREVALVIGRSLSVCPGKKAPPFLPSHAWINVVELFKMLGFPGSDFRGCCCFWQAHEAWRVPVSSLAEETLRS